LTRSSYTSSRRIMRIVDVLALALAATLLAMAGGRLDRPAFDASSGSIPKCVTTANTWTDDRGSVRPWSQQTRLRSNGALLACVSEAGILRFSIAGDAAGGRGAHAIIVLAGNEVWNGLVTDERSFLLHVTAQDALLIAFANDIYRSPEEDRGLWVSAMT